MRKSHPFRGPCLTSDPAGVRVTPQAASSDPQCCFWQHRSHSPLPFYHQELGLHLPSPERLSLPIKSCPPAELPCSRGFARSASIAASCRAPQQLGKHKDASRRRSSPGLCSPQFSAADQGGSALLRQKKFTVSEPMAKLPVLP